MVKYNAVTDSGKREEFESGAVRDTQENKGRFDLIPVEPLFRLALHYQLGAKKYTDNNWRKGIPSTRFYDSAMRHLCSYMRGDRSEDHLAAVLFNVMGIMWNEECLPHVHDLKNDKHILKEITQEEWDEAKQKQGLKPNLDWLKGVI